MVYGVRFCVDNSGQNSASVWTSTAGLTSGPVVMDWAAKAANIVRARSQVRTAIFCSRFSRSQFGETTGRTDVSANAMVTFPRNTDATRSRPMVAIFCVLTP